MATPTQSVQFRDGDSLAEFFKSQDMPAFAIKQKNTLNFKHQGDNMDEALTCLEAILQLILSNESAAIYTLCIYDDYGDKITDKTPCDLSVNFRLCEYAQAAGMGGIGGMSSSSELLREVRAMRVELNKLKAAPAEKEEHRLGLIGELLEMDATQPIVLALAGKVADWIGAIGSPTVSGSAGVGELKRVSGVPGWHGRWKEDATICNSIDVLADHLEDFPEVMAKLARIALNKPTTFSLFVGGLRRMKD